MFGHVVLPHLVYTAPPTLGPGGPVNVSIKSEEYFSTHARWVSYVPVLTNLDAQLILEVPEHLSLPSPLSYQAVHHDHLFH